MGNTRYPVYDPKALGYPPSPLTISGGGGGSGGGLTIVPVKTAPGAGVPNPLYTAAPDEFVPVATALNSAHIKLPLNPPDGARVEILKNDSGNQVIIDTNTSDSLYAPGGPTSFYLNQPGDQVAFQYSAASRVWFPSSFSGGGTTQVIALGMNGLLSTGVSKIPYRIPGSRRIVSVIATIGTLPTGAPVILDVYKNPGGVGSPASIYTPPNNAQRPTIATGGGHASTSTLPGDVVLNAGDLLTWEVIQVGSTYQGSDLGLFIETSAAPYLS